MPVHTSHLNQKVSNALNESRILVLGAQVLLGFQFRSAFEAGFGKLPLLSQYLSLGSLGALLVVLGLLVSPAAYHRIVEQGEDSESLYRFTTGMMAWALPPFALGLAIDSYVVTELLSGSGLAVAVGILVILVALFFWYVLESLEKRRGASSEDKALRVRNQNQAAAPGPTTLADKVDHVLTEARLVLPGVQALLGFQLATVLLDGFSKLPASSQYIHLASLGLITVCTIFLMTPAAYHRIVEQGEDSERFHRFATRMVLAAMVSLALGVAGDLYVVAGKVTGSIPWALGLSGLALSLFLGLWFGLTGWLRHQRRHGVRTKINKTKDHEKA